MPAVKYSVDLMPCVFPTVTGQPVSALMGTLEIPVICLRVVNQKNETTNHLDHVTQTLNATEGSFVVLTDLD